MPDRASLDDIAAIRALLISAFATAEDLCRFCRDRPFLRPLLVDLSPKDSLSDIADKVIAYCQSKLLRDDFLPEVAQVNPRQYKQFVPPLPPIPEPPAKGPGGDEERYPAKPPVERPKPKRVLWWVIGALVLVGVLALVAALQYIVGLPILKRPRMPTVTPMPPVVALRTAHGRYVTATGAGGSWKLRAVTDAVENWERFALLCQEDGKLVLRTYHNLYVTAMNDEGDRDWELWGQAGAEQDWEKFTLLHADSGAVWPCAKALQSLQEEGQILVALQTYHTKDGKHRYVTAMGGDWYRPWMIRAETTGLLDYEKFVIVLLK